ncbi:glutamate 5-kinase [Bacteroides timonensis]|uniref:glutamate 5-kinase n=1 Tax=Bacteroides timonensis TaxID=1470345 RepID=UPI0004B7C096|nr:glutamate 5-kinase [Bacteroides timonensis]
MEQQFSRIAVKVGSNVLTRRDGTLDVTRMSALVDQIAELHKTGVEVILVSSGAVASGRSEVRSAKKLDSVDQRQLFSAVGQAKLINRYYELFREHGIPVGQVLTMKENFATRRHYLNQKNCMTVMLENGVIPIVNENDTISVSELMFTDNDELSGLIASMMDAQALIILSNIDGIYNGSPADPASEVIREIGQGKDLSSYIQTSKSSFGRGGMLTKTNIARKVADEGITVIIANGKRDNILVDILRNEELRMKNEECGSPQEKSQPSILNSQLAYTRFVPSTEPVSSVKKWIAHSEGFAKGELHINYCATELLFSDKAVSILPVGIIDVIGEFEKDDIVRIVDFGGKPIGVGKANCDSAQAREAMGKHGKKPVVHYDYLYIE